MQASPAHTKLTPSKLVFPSFDNLNNYVPHESHSNSSIYSITETYPIIPTIPSNELTNRMSKPLPSNTLTDQLSNFNDDNDQDLPQSQTINVQDYLQSERN